MKKLDFLKVCFIIRKDRIQNGHAPIYLQFMLDSKRLRIATSQIINVDLWDEVLGRCKGNSASSYAINVYLDNMKLETLRNYNELKLKEGDVSAEQLRNCLTQVNGEKKKTLLEVCDILNSKTEKLVGIELGKITYGRYLFYRTSLKEFIKIKFNMEDILLSQLKYPFIVEFEFFLKTERKIQQNTVVKYLRYLIRVCEFAVNHEWMDRNLFSNYKCPVKEAKREFLTQDELDRLEHKVFLLPRLAEVRDVFVFCCYTGYSFKDAHGLTPDHIGKGINGKEWIYTSRIKTDNVSNVPLLDKALEIIDRYKDHPICVSKNRLLPMKSNQKLNAYLKEIADICGISKPMTMHIARHTFATTILLSNGVSMEATSKMLGHSSIKTTQIYGKILETRVAKEMDMLNEKFAPKQTKAQLKAE